ncbi:hypothetical protein CHELA1G11_40096 [Hyphomicrobiales bacterium]|nr:hypothetical protein CHELA1G2_40044 [Hyphomicrobiales bacterium]CAH1696521.1 hypothetical protein CHELA1G11_40096 [Hyphomicrobiales bacterium]
MFHFDLRESVHITIDNYLLSIAMDLALEIDDSGAPNRRRRPQPGVRSTRTALTNPSRSAP